MKCMNGVLTVYRLCTGRVQTMCKWCIDSVQCTSSVVMVYSVHAIITFLSIVIREAWMDLLCLIMVIMQ